MRTSSTSFAFVALLLGLASLGLACAAPSEREGDGADLTETDESALLGRSTREICDAVPANVGANASREEASDAFACANRLYWSTRYTPGGVHSKFYLHRAICTSNPASHYAMHEKQALFYCSLSLHFRMCNTQGLYALKDVPDSEPRRERERAIFHECLQVSGELPWFRSGLKMDGASDAAVTDVVERLYDAYKVRAGVRVAPASVNPERAEHALLERLVRVSYYGVTVPIELLETAFSQVFFALDPWERESQIALISMYRRHLMNVDGRNLLDATDLMPE
jgi:hypothetical protein